MKFSHWKIRNLENRHAYYVPIRRGMGSALDQIKDFMIEHGIRASQCRIIESGARFINLSFHEFVMQELDRKGV